MGTENTTATTATTSSFFSCYCCCGFSYRSFSRTDTDPEEAPELTAVLVQDSVASIEAVTFERIPEDTPLNILDF
jgi:hypothetical protein